MIGFEIFSQCVPVFYNEPVKALAEDCVRIHHSFLLVEYLECRWDETQEGVNKRGVCIDNIVFRFLVQLGA